MNPVYHPTDIIRNVDESCSVVEPSRNIKDSLIELTECIHMIENQVDCLRRTLWSRDADNPEKDIDVVDMDSNIVHALDVVRRINKKLERITIGIGC